MRIIDEVAQGRTISDVTSSELLRGLRRLGAEIDRGRGRGGHAGNGDLPTGTLRAILRQLGLRPEDLHGR